ncbi:hypothetical protein B7P43_G10549 [Cryptotermes secundus]|uniref:Mos1 transposase HTH domain-containing protein n=1 Tax=Cryptotermes secundus TaxID=105785 RepID=A0A2J7PRZ0_9NEOP|nr:hypothetical protein B7P43_G10549 [Cryptotermes secundus]
MNYILCRGLQITAEIHQRLQRAYGSVCMGASSVRRWAKHFKDGNTSIEDEPWNGHPQTASTECNKERVDEIIQDDRRVTVDTIARKLGIGHSAIQEMIESLGYRKVCARWVPRLLIQDYKGQRKAITSELLQRYRHKGDDFLLCIVTGDDSWFHHFELETKWQSMEWHHLHSPSKKKAKAVPSAAEVMGTVFWDAEGLFWLNSWNLGKPSMLLVMSRCCTSSVVHCLINVRDKTSSSCMIKLVPTPLASHSSNCKDGVGSSSTTFQ